MPLAAAGVLVALLGMLVFLGGPTSVVLARVHLEGNRVVAQSVGHTVGTLEDGKMEAVGWLGPCAAHRLVSHRSGVGLLSASGERLGLCDWPLSHECWLAMVCCLKRWR